MAARGKKTVSGGGNGHAFAVVVEEMRGQFKVFGEALEGVRQNVEGLRHEVHTRFDQVDRRLDGVEGRLGRVENAVLEHTRRLKAIRIAVDRKVDRNEIGR